MDRVNISLQSLSSAKKTTSISPKQRRAELDRVWLWLNQLEKLEVRLFETGVRAYIRSGGPSPSIFTTHLDVSKDTHRMIDDWMNQSVFDASGELRTGNRQWMILVEQSERIRGGLILLFKSISSNVIISSRVIAIPEQLPPSYERLQSDVEWFDLVMQSVSAFCEILSDDRIGMDEIAVQEVAQIRPLISQCIVDVRQTATFFKQYAQEYPEAVLSEDELTLLRAYQKEYVARSQVVPPEGLTRQKIGERIDRSDDTVHRVCKRLEKKGDLTPRDKHERRNYNATEVELIIDTYLKTSHRWRDK